MNCKLLLIIAVVSANSVRCGVRLAAPFLDRISEVRNGLTETAKMPKLVEKEGAISGKKTSDACAVDVEHRSAWQ